jgi:hypothetical protein
MRAQVTAHLALRNVLKMSRMAACDRAKVEEYRGLLQVPCFIYIILYHIMVCYLML